MGLTFRINLTLNIFIEKKIDECHYITNIRESKKRYKTLIKLKDNMLIWGEYHKVTQENIMKQIKILCMYQKNTPCNKLFTYKAEENSQNWRFTSIPAGV